MTFGPISTQLPRYTGQLGPQSAPARSNATNAKNSPATVFSMQNNDTGAQESALCTLVKLPLIERATAPLWPDAIPEYRSIVLQAHEELFSGRFDGEEAFLARSKTYHNLVQASNDQDLPAAEREEFNALRNTIVFQCLNNRWTHYQTLVAIYPDLSDAYRQIADPVIQDILSQTKDSFIFLFLVKARATEIESGLDKSNSPYNKLLAYCDQRGNFSSFDLAGHDLHGLDFSQLNLRHANFSESILRDCNFSNSDLNNACIKLADITGANFSGAKMERTITDNVSVNGIVRVGLSGSILSKNGFILAANSDT